MNYPSYSEVFDFQWAFQAPFTQCYTPKTLIENDEQVLYFASFIKFQQDLIQEKKQQLESLEVEEEDMA